ELKSKKLTLAEGDDNRIHIDLGLQVHRSSEVEEALNLVQRLFRDELENRVSHAMFWIGPQYAARLRSTMHNIVKVLPDDLIELAMELTLEKEAQESSNRIRPTILRYNLAVGAVPEAKKRSRVSPYEIHLSMATANRLARKAATEMLSEEVLVYACKLVDLYASLHTYQGLTRTGSDSVNVAMKWEIRGDWLFTGNGYGYIKADLGLAASLAGDLKVDLTPTVAINLQNGWPFPGWVKSKVSSKISDRVTSMARAKMSAIDFGAQIPESFRNEVVGVVRIERLQVDDDTLSVYIGHKQAQQGE
ncbi:MAG: hypothetical protein HY815_22585, partial [Candidatus Riflebacteria bacterium]|nr:hypothetical protein [Candidatus Riflebacteria bacterium]